MTETQSVVTPEALRPSRVRSGSTHSPPTPPPEFNPPADLPLPPLHSVSSGSSGSASPSSGSLGGSASDSSPASSSATLFPRRPDLRAVQRVSDDVILTSPESSGQSPVNSSPIGSDGGEHLVEMRERLLSESSDSGSRRSSETITTSSFPSNAGIDHHGPGSSPEFPVEEKRPSPEPLAGSSRSRRASSPTTNSPEHMWDSVWPATGYPLRPLVVDNLPTYNPAPVSPFVTPTFSAAAPHLSRRPTSPRTIPASPTRRASSPVRISPRTTTFESSQSGSHQSKISPTKHSRNHSSGSSNVRPSDRIETPKSPRSSMDKAHGRSRMSETFSRISTPPTVPTRSISSGRPRRTSFNDAQGLRIEDIGRAPSSEDDIPPIPSLSAPFALPPPIASPALGLAGDDGIVEPALYSPSTTPPPPPVPLGRPAALRRALSDYSTPHAAPPSQLHRTHSITTELGKIPESSDKAIAAPTQEAPKPSPQAEHEDSALDMGNEPLEESGNVTIVDEGDVLPTGDFQMDITFDDEGLNALERIFLLSQSDFGFHRAYVARVVGDLLEDVDPCESVEYVLPLLSGYSMDEDDLVKEAFSAQLHKILWYFFSTCRLITEPGEVMTVTSEGMSSVSKPEQESPAIPLAVDPARRSSLATNGGSSSGGPSSGGFSSGGLSSAGSSLTNPPSSMFDSSDIDTPNSITSVSSDQTAFSPLPYVNVHDGHDSAKEPAELVVQPEILINTFTPLLGNMMLSTNPTVGENTRSAVIAVIGRLRGVVDDEKWARLMADKDERKSFISQNGVHSHDLRPFHPDAKSMVEAELLSGIVLGMGHLSSELPDNYEETAVDEMPEEAEGYRIQLVQEAEAGRAISMFLIGSLCEIYSGPEASKRGFVPEVLGAVDGDETTRTEAAVALSRMAKIVPIEHVPQMLPVFETFVHDEIELVRQAVAIALPALVKRIESLEDRRSIAVDGLKSLYSAGDGCRCAAMEILGELIHAFYDDPLGPPVELVDIYKDDSNEEEVFAGDCDWDIIAAYNFPGVCLTLGSDRWPEIRGLFQRLQDRAGDRVLGTIASYLHELAKILTPAQVAEDLLPVYTRLIDSPEPIRERVFEHIDDFVAGLPPDLGWMTFLGLEKAWELGTLGQWRTREAVALHLPAFFALFVKQERDISSISSMTLAALLDKFAAVRVAAISSIPKSYHSLNGTKFDGPFRDMILGLATAPEYRKRVTFTRCLKEFIKPPPNREAFETFFVPALPRLRHDVVDVRIALAQIVGDLFKAKSYYDDEPNVPAEIAQLVRDLASDESLDVRDTVRHIDLDALGKGKGPAVEVQAPSTEQIPSLARSAERSNYLAPRTSRTESDPDATPQPTAAEKELARQHDPFESSFEHEIHKDDPIDTAK